MNTPSCSTCVSARVLIKRTLALCLRVPVFNADQHHHTDIVVKPRVDNHCLQRRFAALWRRHFFTISSSTSSTPKPLLAEQVTAPTASALIMSSDFLRHAVNGGEGVQILLSTGTTSTPKSMAVQ